jgi:hypothetical protein
MCTSAAKHERPIPQNHESGPIVDSGLDFQTQKRHFGKLVPVVELAASHRSPQLVPVVQEDPGEVDQLIKKSFGVQRYCSQLILTNISTASARSRMGPFAAVDD